MRNRKLSELIKLVIPLYEQGYNQGLCIALDLLEINSEISYKEHCKLEDMLDRERPTSFINKEFYEEPDYKRNLPNGYWWHNSPNHSGTRLRFLETILEKQLKREADEKEQY